jgi:chlorite dismutase
MSQQPHSTSPPAEISLEPEEGWHCSHLYYQFDRQRLAAMEADQIEAGCASIIETLHPEASEAPARLQVSMVSGHKADFAVMLMDACPRKLDAVHQRLLAGPLGIALRPTYSFVSMTEVSEYVPTVDQYADRLLREGEQRDSPAFQAKVAAYQRREPMMRRQRLTPDLPDWPACCFYPMNKKRQVGENWFLLPFSKRNELMAEHARSGMEFAGKVSQLITVAVGLDDWEWGVTLWAKNPQFLKDIVYRMRYDEASARYAEFGPFYVGYVMSAAEMLDHCRIANSRQ